MLRHLTRQYRWLSAIKLPQTPKTHTTLRVFSSENSHPVPKDQISYEIKTDDSTSPVGDQTSYNDSQSEQVDVTQASSGAEQFDFTGVEDYHKCSYCPEMGWRLKIEGLPLTEREENRSKVHRIFRSFGEVKRIQLIADNNDTDACLGFGFAHMKNYEDAVKVVNSLSVSLVEDTPLTATFGSDRRRNIIIYHMEEEDGEDLPKKVRAILGHFPEQSTLLTGSAIRIGTFDSEKKRMVRVTLENADNAVQILRTGHTLSKVKEFSELRIGKDMTPKERIQRQEIRRELQSELRQAMKEKPDMIHVIRKNAVFSFPKRDNK